MAKKRGEDSIHVVRWALSVELSETGKLTKLDLTADRTIAGDAESGQTAALGVIQAFQAGEAAGAAAPLR